MRYFYLVLALFGLVLPIWEFMPWLMKHGLDIPQFFNVLFENKVAGAFVWDDLASFVILIGFILYEGMRQQMKHLWVPIIAATFTVSFGFGLFLYMRELHMERP